MSSIPYFLVQSKRPNNNKRSTGSQILTKSPVIKELKEKQLVIDIIERKKIKKKT